MPFGAGLATLLGGPEWGLLEVGPGGSLSGLARRSRPGLGAIASMRHPRAPQHDAEVLLGALGSLWLAGVEVDWQRYSSSTAAGRRRRVSLPAYPFERRRHWLAAAVESGAGRSAHVGEGAA